MMPVRQDFRENLGLAFDTIRTHKLRSFLAVLGVLIGVALIILVVGLVQGFRASVSEEIASEGLDTAWVARFTQGPGLNGRRPKEERERKPLVFADAQAVMTQCPAVKQTAVSVFEWTQPHTVRYQSNQVAGGEFRGTFPAYLEVYSNANIKAGRFFTDIENEHRENVVVLGENIATALFGKVDSALDKQVLVDGVNFRVIGVRKAIGARSRDITWQFLFEAMTLTGTGGLIGIIVGSAIVMLVPVVSSLKAIVPLWAVIVGFTVSVGIGLIFGVWPATKAAKLNPVEALRYE